jgi:pyruvate formate lyase activating enzyme
MKGYIHSTESFGTVDGPGIRYVVFMQGCPLRCIYCHNPDTWKIGAGQEIAADEILAEYRKNRSFYSKGGITVTGGEPLLQIDFLIDLFKKAKSENIHTCIDTSGVTYNPESKDYVAKLDVLMQYTDLCMLDIKHIDPEKHKAITGKANTNILLFAKYLERKNIPVWIRHIIISGITDDPNDLKKLGNFIGTLKNLKALDVLPYHTLGVGKYKELNIPYPLEGLPPLPVSEAIKAKNYILKGIHQVRSDIK